MWGKKIFSGFMLVLIVFSQFQIGTLYANSQSELSSEKQSAAATIDATEQVIDAVVEKIDAKINNTQTQERLEEKHEEIQEYLQEVQDEIKQENSSEEIKQKVEQAKKVVVLKVVSGITQYEDIEDTISADVANTQQEKKQALEVIQESLQTKTGDYSIIVKTGYTDAKIRELFAKFDDSTQIEFMHETYGNRFYEIFLAEDSIFRQEMLTDIEQGILPENFVGVEIVLPEVFSIETIDLTGEDLSQTWGIEKYAAYNYASDFQASSESITLGVIDTGIDYTHPDLQSNVNQNLGKDFVNEDDDAMDDQGHGTHVAGTIAANVNGSGIMGVNPSVQLVPLKICSSSGFCPSYAVMRALEYAKDENIDILNMSLGGRGNPSDHPICDGIASYTQNGGIAIVASGNSNIDTSSFVPGGCPEALTVGAIDQNNQRASFSNYGPKVDVAAPGVNIYSTYPVNKGSYKKLSGTSMATPHIAGLASIVQSYDSDITSSELKTLLKTYPEGVSSENAKSVAAGINVSALISSLTNTTQKTEEVIIEEEENQEEEAEISVDSNNDNIAEYIEDFEEEEDIEEIPEITFLSLDGITLSGAQIQEGEEFQQISENIFDLSPVVDFSTGVELNSLENSTTKNSKHIFSLSSDEEYPLNEAESLSGVKIEIEEIIEINPPIYENTKTSIQSSIQPLESGVQINNFDEQDIEEVLEEEKSFEVDEQSFENASILSIDTEQISSRGTIIVDSQGNEVSQVESKVILIGEQGESHTGSRSNDITIQRWNQYNCDAFVTRRCNVHLFGWDYSYDATNSNPDVATFFMRGRELYIDLKQAGTTTIELKSKETGQKEVTVYVTAKDIPEVKHYECDVKLGENCNFSVNTQGSNWQYNRNTNYIYTSGNTLQVKSYIVGTTTINQYVDGFHVASFTLSTTPNVPDYYCVTLVGKDCYVEFRNPHIYQFETGGTDLFSLQAHSNGYVKISGLKIGKQTFYAKRDGNYAAAFHVDIRDPSSISPQSTNCMIWELNTKCEIGLDFANLFQYSTSTGGVVHTSVNGSTLFLQSLSVGETDIFIRYGDILIGTVHVKVDTKAQKYNCDVNIGKDCQVYLGRYANYMDFSVTQGSIVKNLLGGDNNHWLHVQGENYGSTIVYVKNRIEGRYIAQIHVNVIKPQKAVCKVLEGEFCDVVGLPQSYNYEVLKHGERVGQSIVNGYRRGGDPVYVNVQGTKIEGLRSGVVEIHIYRADFNNYLLLHVIEVEILEAPITATSYCETRINGRCDIGLRNIGTDKYSIYVTTPGIISIEAKRDYAAMYGISEGETEILIQNNETGVITHRGTVKIEGEYIITQPRPKTELSETSITLDVGESQVIEITQGNSSTAYRVVADYPNIEVSQASNSSFRIKAKNTDHSNVTVHFIDKEAEYKTAKIFVSVVGENSGGSGNGGGENNTPTEFINFEYDYIEGINIGSSTSVGIGVLELTGNPKSVGLETVHGNGEIERFELKKGENGYYTFVVPLDSQNSTLDALLANFNLYAIEQNDDITIYQQNNYLSFINETGLTLTSVSGINTNSVSDYYSYQAFLHDYEGNQQVQGVISVFETLLEVYKEDIINNGKQGFRDVLAGHVNKRTLSSPNIFSEKWNFINNYASYLDDDILFPFTSHQKESTFIQYSINFSQVDTSVFPYRNEFIALTTEKINKVIYKIGIYQGAEKAYEDTFEYVQDIPSEVVESARSIKDLYMSYVYSTSCEVFGSETNCKKAELLEEHTREVIISARDSIVFAGKFTLASGAAVIGNVTGDEDFIGFSQYLGDELFEESRPLLVEMEAFAQELKDINWDALENKEYWSGYVYGYGGTVTSELTAIGGTALLTHNKDLIGKSVKGMMGAARKTVDKFTYAGYKYNQLGDKIDIDTINENDADFVGWKEEKYGVPCGVSSQSVDGVDISSVDCTVLIQIQGQIQDILKANTIVLKEQYPSTLIGYRGSLSDGRKLLRDENNLPIRNANGNLEYTDFNPNDFDVDAFVVSDELANQIVGNWKDLKKIGGEIETEVKGIEQILRDTFNGYRIEEGKTFTFKVWTQIEYENIVKQADYTLID